MPSQHAQTKVPPTQRAVGSIIIGARHRKDLGDIDALAESIRRLGLLQPITVAPDGTLICGLRRLEAVRRLGWITVAVHVRSGVSSRAALLFAEQEDDLQHKQYTVGERTDLDEELQSALAREIPAR